MICDRIVCDALISHGFWLRRSDKNYEILSQIHKNLSVFHWCCFTNLPSSGQYKTDHTYQTKIKKTWSNIKLTTSESKIEH